MIEQQLIDPPVSRSTRFTDASVIAGDVLHHRAKDYMRLNPHTSYESAIKHVLKSDPALARRYTSQE